MSTTPDPRLAPWKEAFRCGDIHPHMRPRSTLVEMESKFDGVAGFLRSLDAGDPQQADLGVKIGA